MGQKYQSERKLLNFLLQHHKSRSKVNSGPHVHCTYTYSKSALYKQQLKVLQLQEKYYSHSVEKTNQTLRILCYVQNSIYYNMFYPLSATVHECFLITATVSWCGFTFFLCLCGGEGSTSTPYARVYTFQCCMFMSLSSFRLPSTCPICYHFYH